MSLFATERMWKGVRQYQRYHADCETHVPFSSENSDIWVPAVLSEQACLARIAVERLFRGQQYRSIPVSAVLQAFLW